MTQTNQPPANPARFTRGFAPERATNYLPPSFIHYVPCSRFRAKAAAPLTPQIKLLSLDRDQTKNLVSRQRETQANPQVFLHKSHTGKKRYNLPIFINGLYESKDLERVKGIEPSS